MLAAGLLLALAAPALAAAEQPSQKALDRYLYTSLRYVINHGVDLYNAGQVDECLRHFRQSLQDLVPVLAGHPELQKLIEDGLKYADSDPAWRAKMAAQAGMPNPQLATAERQKAFALRAVFNEVRATLNSSGGKTPAAGKAATLWDRLGGAKGVSRVVDDFVALAVPDPKVDFTRGGKYKLDDLAVADVKKTIIELISANTGGPLKYTGKPMKELHQGMGITNAEFDAAAADLKKALDKNGVKADAARELLAVVESTRKDIVEGKKPEGETVRGKVTLDGKPLARGKLALTDNSGKAHSADLAADGTFALWGVPAGSYRVTVSDGREVPAAYGDPKTTPITTNVTKGANELDLELKGQNKPDEQPPRVPEAIAVPAGNVVLARLHAEGVQIYESKARADGGLEWVLKGPEAELTSLGKIIGKHYGGKDGPVWEIEGNTVTGEVPPKAAPVRAGTIPWLLLRAKEFKARDGKTPPFTLTYVQRIETEGGVAPPKAPAKAGDEAKVKYTATYVFYIAEPGTPQEKQQ
jgi:hemoglobin